MSSEPFSAHMRWNWGHFSPPFSSLEDKDFLRRNIKDLGQFYPGLTKGL